MPAMGSVALSLLALPPAAGAEAPRSTPRAIVEALYRPYLVDPHAEKDTTIDSVAQVRRHATPALARLLDADRACEKRTQGICALDFDIIIDGQDWELSGFGLEAEAAGDTATVTARFNNMGPRVLAYHFARTGGRWLIDDVVILKDNASAADHPWSLKDTLTAEYDTTARKHR
ncbi:DUF3828 domain-containing protein [Nitrospirillum amazonense]|uniref:DUF3828 domain-containing protein n=1 Tax=Nitrospirillum amazonense TaxID=28077 RepID=UPI001645F418|nr:DUF3828 domain-containing protein [Nitrospirillum amazonense]